ncbi:MAG TPA: hypothetical protein VFE02_10780 [Candidatus Acidoferrales bacterium]|nr:hypothetical protein [Candidatus Acidoferrales bacterium]
MRILLLAAAFQWWPASMELDEPMTDAVPIRYVQIGAVTGSDIALPSAALRSSALVLMGSGIGSIPREGLIRAIRCVLQAVVPGKLKIETQVVPLFEVEETWNKDSGTSRVVFAVTQESESCGSS